MGFFGGLFASLITGALGLLGGKKRNDPPAVEKPRNRFDTDEQAPEQILGADSAKKFKDKSKEKNTSASPDPLGGGNPDDPLGGLSVADALGLE